MCPAAATTVGSVAELARVMDAPHKIEWDAVLYLWAPWRLYKLTVHTDAGVRPAGWVVSREADIAEVAGRRLDREWDDAAP